MPYRLKPRFRGLGVVTVDTVAQAIAQMEGYNTPGTLAARNLNPGNLRSGPGQTGTSGGFAVFPSADAGWAALDNQINLNASKGLTLNEFFAGKPGVYAGYAPSSDSNNPAGYAAFVASQTGADPNVPLSSLLAGDPGSGTAAVDPTAAADSTVDTSGGGLSTTAWVGLAVAAAGLLVWAAG
jgi:hypothetical protein